MALLDPTTCIYCYSHAELPFKMKFGTVATVKGTDGNDLHDLHAVVTNFSTQWKMSMLFMVIFYVLSMATGGLPPSTRILERIST